MPKTSKKDCKYSLRERTQAKSVNNIEELSEAELELLHSKWSTQEIKDLTEAILTHGHLYDNLLEKIPNKTWESYARLFQQSLYVARDKKKSQKPIEFEKCLDKWIFKVENMSSSYSKTKEPLDLALVLKLLSLDGVLENHPLPEKCNGIDIGACYRLLQQAMLGHPLQPLNEPTLKFFYEIFNEVPQENEASLKFIENIKGFLLKSQTDDCAKLFTKDLPQKPVKEYTRKKIETKYVPNSDPPPAPAQSSTSSGAVKEMLLSPIYNPLNMPADLLLE